MYKSFVLSRTLLLGSVLVAMCVALKIQYISTENPVVNYYNTKYISYVNITARQYGSDDPFYYVDIHSYMNYALDNNVSVHFYFHRFSENTYKRGFIDMHWKFCDLIHNNKFFGTAMRQGKLEGPCPFPAGEYHLYNMSIPVKQVPKSFPFRKGRIYCNSTVTETDELIGAGQIDMEIKEARIRMSKN